MEGSSAHDYHKSFDLNAQENDEMLRLYLRKAGLSDEIEHFTKDQRRTLIYDIIKSNKLPGYWVPPTIIDNAIPPPNVRPPPLSPYAERRNINMNTQSISSSSSLGSLQSLPYQSQPHVVNRFVPAPATPPSPSSIVTSSKGCKYEISGPMNFQHISGDMTRDRTRNAFDLTANVNDNVLKKYMMERGISENDVGGMRKQDLIKKIVQSNFTWMPSNRNTQVQLPMPINYATISSNNQKTAPQSQTSLSPAVKTSFANYASLTNKFVDIGGLEASDMLSSPETVSNHRSQHYIKPKLAPPPPPPPPLQHQRISKPTVAPPPPPPSTVTASIPRPPPVAVKPPQAREQQYATIAPKNHQHRPTIKQMPNEPIYSVIVPSKKLHHNQSPPGLVDEVIQYSKPPRNAAASQPQLPLLPVGDSVPPPPPPLLLVGDTVPPPPPPPPPPSAMPSMPLATITSVPNSVGPVPGATAIANKSESNDANNEGENDRDALLESIRKGISLKKVDRKSATISGIKPRAERRPPPVIDFLTELKLRQGITLSGRIKNPSDNPYSGGDESEESHA